MWLSLFKGLKSPAVMMKDAGPRDEPCIILACMLENTDVCPPNFRRMSVINIEVSSGGHLGFRTRLSDPP